MTDQHEPDRKQVEPTINWGDDDDRPAPSGAGTPGISGLDPIPGTPAAESLVDRPGDREPRTSPETERELDQLRRG